MEKKQTALQTLIEWGDRMILEHSMDKLSFAEAIYKAVELLEMEKEQMQNLIIWMYKVSADQPMRFETDIDDIVEQYYNETYGK